MTLSFVSTLKDVNQLDRYPCSVKVSFPSPVNNYNLLYKFLPFEIDY